MSAALARASVHYSARVTLICVPIMVADVASALEEASAAKAAGADLVEYRLDEFFSGEGMTGTHGSDTPEVAQIVELVSRSPLPCIATCRPAGGEGGHYDGDDMARISLMERLGTAFGRLPDGSAEHPPRYIDVELSTYQRSRNLRQKVNLAVEHPEQVRDLRTSLILSTHDFGGRPADLSRRLAAMRAEPAARVVKVAFRARSLRDNLELLDLLAEADRPTIALGMGEFGLLSRVLAPKFGGFLTFASLRPERATAPGQPTVRELIGDYRFRSIGPSTAVYGVAGYPLGHSLSPVVHNAGFAACGIDAVYVPMPIPGGDSDAEAGVLSLKATLLELVHHERLGLSGVSVTIPHKQSLVRLAQSEGWSIDPPTRAIGAGNTLVVRRGADGGVLGVDVHNTDAPAIAEAISAAVGPLEGVRAAVLGAGGVARAAAYALAAAGATVVVYARDPARARGLVESIEPHVPGKLVPAEWSLLGRSCAQVFVNATPVGMAGGPEPAGTPLEAAVLRACDPRAVVMDTVYNPIETRMLVDAKNAGLRTVEGVTMFARQAEEQFRLWTRRPPPAGLFERLARERLARSG